MEEEAEGGRRKEETMVLTGRTGTGETGKGEGKRGYGREEEKEG